MEIVLELLEGEEKLKLDIFGFLVGVECDFVCV